MNFSRFALSSIGPGSSKLPLLALVGLGMISWQAPAAAQKKDSKQAQAAPKASYSKEFVAAYKPVETQANAAAPDYAALKVAIPTLTAAAQTPDDKLVAGRMIFLIGQKTNDFPIALQGAEMALQSGRADPAQQAQFSFVASQLAFNLKDYAKARSNVENAIKLGYTQNDPELLLAETYFAQDQYAEGLKYLSDAIAARKAAGQPVSEAWVKRGFAMAYRSKLDAEARKWSLLYAGSFPSETSWGDAIAVAINSGRYDRPEILDLLRLARRTNTLRTRAMYLEYIDSADARKLPSEVIAVMDAGIAAKHIDPSIQMVKDARAAATARIAADKAELPALQRDASSPRARLVTVMAAADTLLSYGRAADAETLYAKALSMPGVDTAAALTRLGIAQLDQGKHAEAKATFDKVQGARRPIAELWALYAAQKASA